MTERIKLIWLGIALAGFLASHGNAQAPGNGALIGVGTPAPASFAPSVNAGTDVVCALHADVITGLTCNNQVTDATSATAFSSTVAIPAGTLASNSTRFTLNFGYIGTGSTPTAVVSVKLGSTVVYTASNFASGVNNVGFAFVCNLVAATAASAAAPVIAACGVGSPTNVAHNTLLTATTKSIAVDTTVAQTLSITVIFGAATAGNAVWLYGITP